MFEGSSIKASTRVSCCMSAVGLAFSHSTMSPFSGRFNCSISTCRTWQLRASNLRATSFEYSSPSLSLSGQMMTFLFLSGVQSASFAVVALPLVVARRFNFSAMSTHFSPSNSHTSLSKDFVTSPLT